MSRTIALLATLGVLVAAETARAQSPAQRPPQTITVEMVDNGGSTYRFEPAEITVRPGDTIRWVQADVAPHNVEFEDAPELGDDRMGPMLTTPGETYELVIDDRFAQGVYSYVCTPHVMMGMTGEITVTGPGG